MTALELVCVLGTFRSPATGRLVAAAPSVLLALPRGVETSRRTSSMRIATASVALLAALASSDATAAPVEGDGETAEVPSGRTLDPKGEQLYRRARLHYELREYADAQARLEELRAHSPDWRPIHFDTGLVLEARGLNHQALEQYEIFYAYATPEERAILHRRMEELTKRMRTTGIALWATGAALVIAGFATIYIPGDLYETSYGTDFGAPMICLYGGCAGLFAPGIALISVGAMMHARSRKAKSRLQDLSSIASTSPHRSRFRWDGGLRFAF